MTIICRIFAANKHKNKNGGLRHSLEAKISELPQSSTADAIIQKVIGLYLPLFNSLEATMSKYM
jgi:hypothetical protein